MRTTLLILLYTAVLAAQEYDTVSFVHGADLFYQEGISHTVLGGSEIGVAAVCAGWMLFDMVSSGENKMVHLYASCAAVCLAFRGSWDIYMGKKNLIHFRYMRKTYPMVRRRLSAGHGEVYDIFYQEK